MLVVILVVGGIFLMNPLKQNSKLEMISNGTAYIDSSFSVKLMDFENKSIVNGSIDLTILDNAHKVVFNQSVKTNRNGEASLQG